MQLIAIKRALISVSDKTGVVEFARTLAGSGVEILSTGGTYKALCDAGVPVKTVDSYTGHPEIMDGRVKTLHPRIHGGILAIRDNPSHVQQMEQNGIKPIDLVVVNLYPFAKTIAKPDVTIEEAIENIDIGGPTMVRSSAKNHAFVTIVVDPLDYSRILDEIKRNGGISFDTRKVLAVKAYRHTADYDAGIDAYLSKVYLDEKILRLSYSNGIDLRYGENPHQSAVFYKDKQCRESSIATAKQVHGKELSYNNILDGDAALDVVKEVSGSIAAAVVKHSNPCGFATGSTLAQALEAAWSGDIVSAFGSVIAVSRTVDLEAAKVLGGRFVEVLIAPGFDSNALRYLQEKSSSLRLLEIGDMDGSNDEKFSIRYVTGGLLYQDKDKSVYTNWEQVTKSKFLSDKGALAKFAMTACKQVKSNAIVLAQEYAPGQFRVIGMGAGQPNRIDSLRKLAVTKAQENFAIQYTKEGKQPPADAFKKDFGELVMASDAFFPFADTIDEANAVGIRYIVQPGGSKKDDEVIAACDKYGISMVVTGMRHFKH